jgi:hypothetical protein
LLRIVHVACRLADALGYDITRPLVPLRVEAVLTEPEPAPHLNPPEQDLSEASSAIGSLRLYVAAAIITVVVTFSAILLWR